METTAKVVLDSVSRENIRLTTMEVTLHRFILAEFNTHRMFSRNSASSRAIPVSKQIDKVRNSPALPLVWPSEKPGMSGGSELQGQDLDDAKFLFTDLQKVALHYIEEYLEDHPEPENRLHKSLLNRLLEPFMWHTIIVTATEWDNFWGLRCSPLAQPEMRVAAEKMKEAYDHSRPAFVRDGEWHMPYLQHEEVQSIREEGMDPRKISAARCARVSYLTHEGTRDFEKDMELYYKLTTDDPPHSSPLEHVATPLVNSQLKHFGNFRHWVQLRHTVESQKLRMKSLTGTSEI